MGPTRARRPAGRIAMTLVVAAVAAALPAGPASAAQYLYNHHYILDYLYSGNVYLGYYGFPGSAELHPTGSIANLYIDDGSTCHVLGGAIVGNARLWDPSFTGPNGLNVLSGSIGGNVSSYYNSQFTVTGGTIGGSVSGYDDSHTTLHGGSIGAWLCSNDALATMVAGQAASLRFEGNGRGVVEGGQITGDLDVHQQATATLRGGQLGGAVNLTSTGGLTIEGAGFALDGAPLAYGTFDAGASGPISGLLTGTLAGGQPLSQALSVTGSGRLTLTPGTPPPGIFQVPRGVPVAVDFGRVGRHGWVQETGWTVMDVATNDDGGVPGNTASMTIGRVRVTVSAGWLKMYDRYPLHDHDHLTWDHVYGDYAYGVYGSPMTIRVEGLEPGRVYPELWLLHYDCEVDYEALQARVEVNGVARGEHVTDAANDLTTNDDPDGFWVIPDVQADADGEITLLVETDTSGGGGIRINGLVLTPEPAALGLLVAAAPLTAKRRRKLRRQ